MSAATKKTLQNFQWDFDVLNKTNLAVVKANATWLLPQLLSFLGVVVTVQYAAGQVSASRTFQVLGSRVDNEQIVFDNGRVLHKQELGLMIQLCAYPHPSHVYAARQTSEFGARYSAAVPWLLSALRQYQDVCYSTWDYTDPAIQYFLAPELYATTQAHIPDFDAPTLLAIRGSEDPTKYSSCTQVLHNKQDLDFYALPKLAKLQLTQTWIYHPTLCHKLSLGLGTTPDTLRPPLVSPTVLQQPGIHNPNLLPWQ